MTTKEELKRKMAEILDAIYDSGKEEGRVSERRAIFNAIGASGAPKINPAEFTTGIGAKRGRPRKRLLVPTVYVGDDDVQPRFTDAIRNTRGPQKVRRTAATKRRHLGTLDGTIATVDAKIAELKPAVVRTKDMLDWGHPAAKGTIYRAISLMVRRGKLTKLESGLYQPVV